MLKVLVVDDSLIIRRQLTNLLEEMGHQVIGEATNGKSAISAYKEKKPDLVTMDITMPDMDGIEAVKNIKAKDSNAKILMVTSHGQEKMVIKSIRTGAKGYILKPATVKKLEEALVKIFPYLATKVDEKEVVELDDEISQLED